MNKLTPGQRLLVLVMFALAFLNKSVCVQFRADVDRDAISKALIEAVGRFISKSDEFVQSLKLAFDALPDTDSDIREKLDSWLDINAYVSVLSAKKCKQLANYAHSLMTESDFEKFEKIKPRS